MLEVIAAGLCTVILWVIINGLFIRGIYDFFRWNSRGMAWIGIGLMIILNVVFLCGADIAVKAYHDDHPAVHEVRQ